MLANPLGAACPCAEYQFLGATAPGQPGRQFRSRSPGTTRPNLPATASGGAAHRTLLVKPRHADARVDRRAHTAGQGEVRRFRKAFAHLRPKRA